ncbi:MAG: DUF2520 domain-containing protein [Ignavibacterium sp.]|nr:MAG: DUF2520 domain-containing protein [Ignavibacterium sp.]
MNKNVVIIGAGRISYSLASALTKSEYNIVSIISKNINSSNALAKKIRIDNFSDDLNDIPKSAGIYFLSVPDGEIAAVALQLSKLKLNFKQSLFIHLSGAENISVLKPLKRKRAKIASLHPMQTFPSKIIVSLKGVHTALETDNESTYKLLLKISKGLQLIPFRIDSKNKSYYHLAGVYASNFLAGNLFLANQLLSLNKIDREKHFDILRSTINSTLKNIENIGPANALSGPVDRGDIQTIKNHISSLKKNVRKSSSNYFSTLLKNYLLQSLSLIDLVEEKQGHLANSHTKIKELLVQELSAL